MFISERGAAGPIPRSTLREATLNFPKVGHPSSSPSTEELGSGHPGSGIIWIVAQLDAELDPMHLPPEVYEHVRSVFEQANERVSAMMTRIPTTHETSLDHSLIDAISQFAAPFRVAPDWTVRIETHYLGGGRHFGEWEIADIGLILIWRDKGEVRLRKFGLLQSKRLYPIEQEMEEDTRRDYEIGFARLMPGDEGLTELKDRTFSFLPESRYRVLLTGDHQYKAIAAYEEHYAIPVHYLLYQPLVIPWRQVIPVTDRALPSNSIGAEVARTSALRGLLDDRPKGYAPARSDVTEIPRWRLEAFVADELLRCREGYRANNGPDDPGIGQMFANRSGPIAAAIGITIDRL
jgi:hypothetical protein